MKTIKVLVSGCACNQKFAALVEQVVAQNGWDVRVEKVDDIMEIMRYDAMTLPALVLDDKLLATGQKSENELTSILAAQL